MTSRARPEAVKVVIATTVMLSLTSSWPAAAIVLSEPASSADYAGGIAESAAGKAAPWFILTIMLFSYAVCPICEYRVALISGVLFPPAVVNLLPGKGDEDLYSERSAEIARAILRETAGGGVASSTIVE